MALARHLAFAFIMLATVCGASAAWAQSGERWQAPEGLFSLDFQSWGWSELSDFETDSDRPMLLGIEHRQFQEGGLMRTCFVTERRLTTRPGTTQEVLNALAARADGNMEATGAPRSLNRLTIDGVLVNDAVYERPLYQHMLWFLVVDDQSIVRQIHINCGAAGEVPAEVEANIAGMLQTLRIGGGS